MTTKHQPRTRSGCGPAENGVSRRVKPNTVVRQARDRDGCVLGHFACAHDGTLKGIAVAARHVSDEMFLIFDQVSNIESPIIATDAVGVVRWSVSPNFRLIEEVGPVE